MPKLVKQPTRITPPYPIVERRERLAINIADVMRYNLDVVAILLGGKLDTATPIRTDPDRIDETAALFTCDLLGAATIVDTIWGHDRRSGTPPARAYLRKGTAWTKLPTQVPLTRLVGDTIHLNHEVFPPIVAAEDLVAPIAKAVCM